VNNFYGFQAHNVLEYLLTKTALDGSIRSSTIRIPYQDLVKGVGTEKEMTKDDMSLVLVVEFSLKWDSGDGTANIITMDEEDAEGFSG
jgi:hypothetical protein